MTLVGVLAGILLAGIAIVIPLSVRLFRLVMKLSTDSDRINRHLCEHNKRLRHVVYELVKYKSGGAKGGTPVPIGPIIDHFEATIERGDRVERENSTNDTETISW